MGPRLGTRILVSWPVGVCVLTSFTTQQVSFVTDLSADSLYIYQAGNKEMAKGVTLAEAVKTAGYHTMMVGKWHLDSHPVERGFDRFFRAFEWGNQFLYRGQHVRLDEKPFVVPSTGFYTTDAKTDYALEFLDEAKATQKPFLLYMAYNALTIHCMSKKKTFANTKGDMTLGGTKSESKRFLEQKQLGIVPQEPSFRQGRRGGRLGLLTPQEREWESERMAAPAQDG